MFGFMLPTWLLSMFINNITTVAVMMPILEQVLVELEAIRYRDDDEEEAIANGGNDQSELVLITFIDSL